jgi:beta-lactamase class A
MLCTGTAAAQQTTAPAGLQNTVASVAAQVGGRVGVCITQVETGESVSVAADEMLPLYSVVKFPLAVLVFHEVGAGKLHLDTQVTVTQEDRAPGVTSNAARWKELPVQKSVRELLEYALLTSDNTACDRLMRLLGGPAEVTKGLRALGINDVDVKIYTREIGKYKEHPNRGSARAVTALLARLQKGEILAREQRDVLFAMMEKCETGAKRIRGDLPPGTTVLDKTGTGGDGAATNDVGIFSLPGGGHVAVSVLISGSRQPDDQQEAAIARIARAAYDAFSR